MTMYKYRIYTFISVIIIVPIWILLLDKLELNHVFSQSIYLKAGLVAVMVFHKNCHYSMSGVSVLRSLLYGSIVGISVSIEILIDVPVLEIFCIHDAFPLFLFMGIATFLFMDLFFLFKLIVAGEYYGLINNSKKINVKKKLFNEVMTALSQDKKPLEYDDITQKVIFLL